MRSTSSISNTPSKFKRNNISVILEEKENPSLSFNLNLEKALNEKLKEENGKIKEKLSKDDQIDATKQQTKEIAIHFSKKLQRNYFTDSCNA
jgi:hypothetical protein